MKRLTFKLSNLWLPILIILVLIGCHQKEGHDNIAIKLKRTENVQVSPDIDQKETFSLEYVLAEDKYQGGFFWVETRKKELERFKCSQCHQKNSQVAPITGQSAHQEINFKHGNPDKQMSCFTCHNDIEYDYLISSEKEKIDFDHSYRLCGNCHFRQKIDWIGGAHGKRVETWKGKRILKNCTSCHNPHSPRFAKRWPKTYSLPLDK